MVNRVGETGLIPVSPLTPPYVPFGIRRFLNLHTNGAIICREKYITIFSKQIITDSSLKYWAFGSTPKAFLGIRKQISLKRF